jgi:peptide/nickel transport system ATP-binding protein
MSESVVSIARLSVRVVGSGAQVVRQVTFDVRPGETVCVVGESGSGKSVTALAIMGLLPKDGLQADSGAILLEGEDLLQATPERLRELRGNAHRDDLPGADDGAEPGADASAAQIDEVLRSTARVTRGRTPCARAGTAAPR